MTKKGRKPAAVGIVGVGGRGFHCFAKLLSAHADARVVALADVNLARAKSAAAALPSPAPACYPGAEAMLAAEKLDGVVITTPDFTHEAITLSVIGRGIPVLVDKPLATTAAGCLRIIEAAERNKTMVVVGFNLRHQATLRAAKKIIESGEIGNLALIENREFYRGGRTYMSRWNRRLEWSGGLWVHKGSHDFDILNWWNAAGRPVRVACFSGLNAFRPENIPFPLEKGRPAGPYCSECHYYERCPDRRASHGNGFYDQVLHSRKITRVDNYRPDLCMYLSDKDTHDNGITIVEYDNNVRASHAECFLASHTDRLYTVVGDRGVMELSLHGGGPIRLRPRWADRDQLVKVETAGEEGHGGADPVLVDTFVGILRGSGDAPRATARDGLRSVAVGQAAELSWREHRMVEISELVDPASF